MSKKTPNPYRIWSLSFTRGSRNRTHIDGFGDRCSTFELCPYVFQLAHYILCFKTVSRDFTTLLFQYLRPGARPPDICPISSLFSLVYPGVPWFYSGVGKCLKKILEHAKSSNCLELFKCVKGEFSELLINIINSQSVSLV